MHHVRHAVHAARARREHQSEKRLCSHFAISFIVSSELGGTASAASRIILSQKRDLISIYHYAK